MIGTDVKLPGVQLNRRRRGVALIATLLILVILLILCTSFVRMMSRDFRTSEMEGESYINLYTAEAGLNYGFWLIKHNMTMYPRIDKVRLDPSDNDDVETDLGGVYNLPFAGIRGAEGTDILYSPELSRQKLYANKYDAEHIYLSDLALSSKNTDNFLTSKRCCSTFQIRYESSVSTDDVAIYLVSTAKLREIPDSFTFGDDYEDLSTNTLDDLGFKELSSRTLVVRYNFKDFAHHTSGTVISPSGAQPSVANWSLVSDEVNYPGKSAQASEWREWFR